MNFSETFSELSPDGEETLEAAKNKIISIFGLGGFFVALVIAICTLGCFFGCRHALVG